MERAALLRRLTWQTATVIGTTFETPRVKTITLAVPDWPGHRAGQHVDVRLTAPDGYQTQRSYSIASAPEDDYLSLTVERLDDGEVSPYLVDELREGDELEFRGPIGGYFVWDNEVGGPLFLVAGGSGLVPLRSMLRHHRAIGSRVPVRVLCSARSLELLIYCEELMELAAYDLIDVSITLTREAPSSWRGHRGRIDPALCPPPDGQLLKSRSPISADGPRLSRRQRPAWWPWGTTRDGSGPNASAGQGCDEDGTSRWQCSGGRHA